MIQVTQQQRDNALQALHVMWPSVPPENVAPQLKHFVTDFAGNEAPNSNEPLDCGSFACFGGWCTVWPPFIAQGVRLSDGVPCMPGPNGDLYGLSVAGELFGAMSLFCRRGALGAEDPPLMTDHELVSARLRRLINNSEVV